MWCRSAASRSRSGARSGRTGRRNRCGLGWGCRRWGSWVGPNLIVGGGGAEAVALFAQQVLPGPGQIEVGAVLPVFDDQAFRVERRPVVALQHLGLASPPVDAAAGAARWAGGGGRRLSPCPRWVPAAIWCAADLRGSSARWQRPTSRRRGASAVISP